MIEREADPALALDEGHPLAAADVGPDFAPADVDPDLGRGALEDHPIDDALDDVVVAGQLALIEDGDVLRPDVDEDLIADREGFVGRGSAG